jgi:ribosomal protein S18 acetylase RimI-like enzyme
LDNTPSSIVVRNGRERDYPAIARIQQLCPESAQWPVGDYSAFQTLLAMSGREAVGFCAWRQTAPDEAELLNIGVDPAWRRRGAATALLDALSRAAHGNIFLEVAEGNAAAISLYSKHGWDKVGVRAGYYHHGTLNAIVMKKSSW